MPARRSHRVCARRARRARMRIAPRQLAGALFFCPIVALAVAPTRAKTPQSIDKSRLFEPWGTSSLGLIPAEITTRRRVSRAATRSAHLLTRAGVERTCSCVRASSAPAHAATRSAYLLTRAGVAPACSRMRASPPPAHMYAGVACALCARVYVRARTHPPPTPTPYGGGGSLQTPSPLEGARLYAIFFKEIRA